MIGMEGSYVKALSRCDYRRVCEDSNTRRKFLRS